MHTSRIEQFSIADSVSDVYEIAAVPVNTNKSAHDNASQHACLIGATNTDELPQSKFALSGRNDFLIHLHHMHMILLY